MAEDTDIESYWEGIRPPREPETQNLEDPSYSNDELRRLYDYHYEEQVAELRMRVPADRGVTGRVEAPGEAGLLEDSVTVDRAEPDMIARLEELGARVNRLRSTSEEARAEVRNIFQNGHYTPPADRPPLTAICQRLIMELGRNPTGSELREAFLTEGGTVDQMMEEVRRAQGNQAKLLSLLDKVQ